MGTFDNNLKDGWTPAPTVQVKGIAYQMVMGIIDCSLKVYWGSLDMVKEST